MNKRGKITILIALIVAIFATSMVQGATIRNNILIFNGDKDDSLCYVIVRLQTTNDSVLSMDTLGTVRFLCPYVVDSIHIADSIKTRKLYALTSGHRAIRAIVQDSVAIHASAGSGRIGVGAEAGYVALYGIVLNDTALYVKSPKTYGIVALALDSLGAHIFAGKYGLKVEAKETENPPQVTNNSYAIMATAEDSFALYAKAGWTAIYAEACSTGGLAGYFEGNVHINGILTLESTIWQCEDFNIKVPKLGTGNPPAENTEGEFPTHDYDPASDEEIYFTACFPPKYKDGDSVKVIVDWFVDVGAAADTYVVWGVEYKMITTDSIFDFANTTTTLCTTLVKSTNKHATRTPIYITTTDFVSGGRLKYRVYRDADNGDDNFKSDSRATLYRFAYKRESP